MTSQIPATVAEVILRHRAAYIEKHRPPEAVHQLLNLLPLCRTAALGGHLYACASCGYEHPRYNSCGNRHCPACQSIAREAWLAEQEEALLDLPYFHLVFTLPGELQPLILRNKTVGYNLLFKCTANTLLKFGRDPKHQLGGQLGFTAVLHTWNQRLLPHAHLHVLVPAGALSKDKQRFTAAPTPKWLFPVRALSEVFRAMFLKRLMKAHRKEPLLGIEDDALAALTHSLRAKPWVVYAKRAFAGPEQVLHYLGRYTHKVAISSARIKTVDDQRVTIACRDPDNAAKKTTLSLEGVEFLRRFFLHVLPKGFTRIRHYGFLGNAVRKTNIPLIRARLGQSEPEARDETPMERMERVYGIDLGACPKCKTGRMTYLRELPPTRCNDPPLPQPAA